jgi:hypothetical protein
MYTACMDAAGSAVVSRVVTTSPWPHLSHDYCTVQARAMSAYTYHENVLRHKRIYGCLIDLLDTVQISVAMLSHQPLDF